jgi:methylmalonyl-CoA/ethylmalonyl-CoA epimerase
MIASQADAQPEILRTALLGSSFHHIGVACYDLDREESAFSALGYSRETADFFDPIQGIDGRFLIGGGPRLELLKNHADRGPLTPWLKKGVRFYHVAYETDSLADAAATLARAGAKQVVAPVRAVAFDGRLISFHMLSNLSLVELISRT